MFGLKKEQISTTDTSSLRDWLSKPSSTKLSCSIQQSTIGISKEEAIFASNPNHHHIRIFQKRDKLLSTKLNVVYNLELTSKTTMIMSALDCKDVARTMMHSNFGSTKKE